MSKLNNIPKLWQDGLDIDEEMFSNLLAKDKEVMYCFGLASAAVKTGKHRNSPAMVRMKIKAIKNEYIDAFLYSYLKKKDITIKLKNKLILEYYPKYKRNQYESIIKELDSLLISPKCNCSNVGFGFCFCNPEFYL